MAVDKRLSHNVSSSYIEAANKLKSKQDRRRIVAYVESYDDVFFWRSVLCEFETNQLYFQVMLPSQPERLERGKKAALMGLLTHGVGSDLIACVDADYDYLIQGKTPVSEIVITNPYVFHTYAYAIENLQCYAPSLYETCVMVTLNDERVFDMEDFLQRYSEIVFPLFVWSIWFYRTPRYNEFTLSEFSSIIDIGKFRIDQANHLLDRLKNKVSHKIVQFHAHYPHAKNSYLQVKEDLKQLGVTPQTTYLYIQGHHLFDKIVVPMMEKVCNMLVRDREQEITTQSIHGTQQRNELSAYRNSIEEIEAMLKKNTGYKNCELVKKIQEDIRTFLADNALNNSRQPH